MTTMKDREVLEWDMKHLHAHLEGVIALELWTVPYYMSAMYSIKDPASKAYRLIQDVVHEEMLHTQLACNITNAFGFKPILRAPQYGGPTVPHINFDLDDPNPTTIFHPFSTELGPLDLNR